MSTISCPLLLALLLLALASANLKLTLRSQAMSNVGRQEWLAQHNVMQWEPAATAFVIVDMWDKHWCPSATTRVAELATPMNAFIKEARNLGFNIVWAPSDVTAFYPPTNSTARNNTLSLQHHHCHSRVMFPSPPSRLVQRQTVAVTLSPNSTLLGNARSLRLKSRPQIS